ncbi:OmpA family protein [Flavobacteriales bacterium]|nr:OmpA family protein [Flavobacteriales bacterium]
MRIILIFLLFFSRVIFAQDCELNSFKNKREFKKINKLIQSKDFFQANSLLKNTDDHPVFTSLRAELAWLEGDIIKAQDLSDEVLYVCEDNFPIIYYILGEIAYQQKDFISSANYLQISINHGLVDKYYDNAVKFLPKAQQLADIISNPVPFNPLIIEGVSTEYDEYLPAISPDQELIFFTRRYLKKGIDIITPTFQEEFISSKIENDVFSIGQPLSYPFNIEDNEGGACISIDNNLLFFTKCSRVSGNYNNCDIFYSEKKDGKWGEIQSFGKEICPMYSWESQPSLSSDGKSIIFASDREGGYGGVDLYIINKDNNGLWSKPINLGPEINSENNEKSPFLHTDGKTLFFASDNFPSLGGYDIFYSRKDSLNMWNKPINIGYPINSKFNEISLFVSTDGNQAIFASNNLEGIGGWDLYSFDLYSEAKPERVFFIKGDLFDSNGENINDVEIEIKNINTKEVKVIKVKNGEYAASLTLSKDDDVLITVKKKGYSFNSQYISSENNEFFSPTNLNFELKDIVEGESFLLNNIYFELDSYELNEVSNEIIIEFAEYLKTNSSMIISINGYTDNIGELEYNKKLSRERALSVYSMLITYGIAENRLQFKGYGEENPKNDNSSEEMRELNRRTEFFIIKR